jgi:hypothetical protein
MQDENKPPSKLTALFFVRSLLPHLPHSLAEGAVLLALASFADPNGHNARPSLQRMATILGCSKRTVARALAKWEAAGLISKQSPASNTHGRGNCAVWRVVIDANVGIENPVSPRSFPKVGVGAEKGSSTRPPDFAKVVPQVGNVGPDSTLPTLPSKENITEKNTVMSATSSEGLSILELEERLEAEEIDYEG